MTAQMDMEESIRWYLREHRVETAQAFNDLLNILMRVERETREAHTAQITQLRASLSEAKAEAEKWRTVVVQMQQLRNAGTVLPPKTYVLLLEQALDHGANALAVSAYNTQPTPRAEDK